jgi:hypothetical protein
MAETKTNFMKYLLLFSLTITSFLTVQAQADSLQQYAGSYVFGDGSPIPSVDVVMTDGALTMSSSAGNSSLIKLGVDSFSIVDFNGTAVFRRSEDSKISGVHIEAMGYVMDGQKQQNGIWIFSEYFLAENKNRFLILK